VIPVIKHALEREGGFAIEIAGSGDAALKSVAEDVPDLVILDLNLPVLNGVEVCRIMRGRPETAKVPIIMLTARSTENDRINGLDIGADDYMPSGSICALDQTVTESRYARLRRRGW
jgi:two-component system phosphate regulon response regulator PhoB